MDPLERPPLPPVTPWVRTAVGFLVRIGLAAFFHRIERFHAERAPAEGPVLFVSNHPGSLTDAFIIGSSVSRVVHFVATVKLFKSRPIAALLSRCGVVPINRKQDDPSAMKTVEATFEHCFHVLEHGGAIGIFPEGVSYNDELMRPVKTGAARMALEAEARSQGKLGLKVAPVGLTYAAKGRFRSDVLVHFGEPFAVADCLEQYRVDAAAGVRALSAAIEQRIQELILNLKSIDHQRIVASVKRLYLDRLRAGNLIVTEPISPHAEELVLGRAIAQALMYFETHYPERLTAFVTDLMRYERRLWMLGLPDQEIESFALTATVPKPAPLHTAALVLGAPIAIYGWLHRLAPMWLTEWAVVKLSPPDNVRAQVAHASMLAGFVAFGAAYAIAAGLMWRFAGATVAALYLVSLPLTGVFAHYYLRALYRYTRRFKASWVLVRLPLTRRSLARMRARLIAEVDAFRADYRKNVLHID